MTKTTKNNFGVSPTKRNIAREVFLIELCCQFEGEHLLSIQFSEKDALEWFPEVNAKLISEKIGEWREHYEHLVSSLGTELSEKSKSASAEEWPIWKMVIELKYDIEFQKIYRQLRRLARLKDFFTPRAPPDKSGMDWNARIERVKVVPIETIIDIKLRPSGDKLIGLCPLHPDKSPSFYIYCNTNTFYCFGCGKGGDIIKFIMLLHGCSFIEALRHIEHYGK